MTMKVCTKCSERKSLVEYGSNGNGGKRAQCLACHRKAKRDAYHGEARRRIQQRVLANYHRKRSQLCDTPTRPAET